MDNPLIYQVLFFASLALFAGALIFAVVMARRHPLRRFSRNLLIGLVVFEIFLGVMHIISYTSPLVSYWDWFFDVRYEFNLGSIFSATQLTAIGIAALILALLTPKLKLWIRLYWVFLCLVFVFLGADEFYSFHETLGGHVHSEAWRVPYAIAAVALFVLSLIVFAVRYRKSWHVLVLLFGGLALIGVAAIGIEDFVGHGFVDQNPSLEWMYVFEEVFEMVGATMIMLGMVSLMGESIPETRWSLAKRIFVGLAAFDFVFMALTWFVLPALEARYIAHPLDVKYDGGLELLGYNLSPSEVKPGEELAVTLFWRANEALTQDYSLSVHLLGHPDVATAAQTDLLEISDVVPNTAWFPHVVMRYTVYIQLPRNMPVPASYWMMVRPWYGPWPLGRPWQDTTGLTIQDAGGAQQLAADAVIAAHVPALPDAPPPAPPTSAHYDFPSEGFILTGYALPDAPITERALPVSFWWQTRNNEDRQLSQFFHLVPAGGGETQAFDQEPFGGKFPTEDWPAGMDVMDPWSLTIPDTLAAGTYDVYTGLYDLSTMERMPVVDANGQPVQDNSIHLGTIDYQPAAHAAVLDPGALDPAQVCYAVSDWDTLRDTNDDTLVAINRATGHTVEIGKTGTLNIEGMTFNQDHTALYAMEETPHIGQFGTLDMQTGAFLPVGDGLSTRDNPARNAAIGGNVLVDVDGMTVDPQGTLWGVTQDEDDYLFQIDPATGQVIRDTFGVGTDYIKIDLTRLPGPTVYHNIEDLAIDPVSGIYYVIAADTGRIGMLAKLDFDTIDLSKGTMQAVPLTPFYDEAGQRIDDMQGLSFTPDGTMYATSTNNSNAEANYDVLWRVDPATGNATPLGHFSQDVDLVDYEALACSGR